MPFLTPENIVAVALALAGAVVSLAADWRRQRRAQRRKRIGYRVQMDIAVGDRRDKQRDQKALVGLFDELPHSPDYTLVLLRIENVGTDGIVDADYTNPDPNQGLAVEFTDRTVQRVEVISDPKAKHLSRHFVPGDDDKGGLQYSGNTIELPRVPLDEDQHFKLLVLLSGGAVECDVEVTGGIRGGDVRRTLSMPIDATPPWPSRRILWSAIAALVAGVLTVSGFAVLRPRTVHLRPPPMGCAKGQLGAIGSTAFAPTLVDLARRYMADCPGSTITADPHGSDDGVRTLAESRGAPPTRIALSDGPKPPSYPQLAANRVALITFAVVVNNEVNIKNLTLDQISAIYQGHVLNWRQLGGRDLPIRMVSRNADSGTRELFRRTVLGGTEELTVTSRDCKHKNNPGRDRVIRCELGSTGEVLTNVASVPGAIGYGELRAAAGSHGLHVLGINGRVPSVTDAAYPFTTVEYAYTYRKPPVGSLAESFLSYVIRGNGQDVMMAHGHMPCFSPTTFGRCQNSN